MPTKFFAVSGGILTALAILYVGNLTVETTPEVVAKGSYEYKFVELGCGAMMGSPTEAWNCIETAVNKQASEGWRLVSADGQSFMADLAIFEKEQ